MMPNNLGKTNYSIFLTNLIIVNNDQMGYESWAKYKIIYHIFSWFLIFAILSTNREMTVYMTISSKCIECQIFWSDEKIVLSTNHHWPSILYQKFYKNMQFNQSWWTIFMSGTTLMWIVLCCFVWSILFQMLWLYYKSHLFLFHMH